jgi:hypothetical protein
MKKLILIAFSTVFTINIIAENASIIFNENVNIEGRNKYCAEVKDGKLTMMHQEKVMVAEVTLENGTRITPDANVIKKDGTKMTLKAGECVDMEGNMVELKDKIKKEESDKNYK